MIAQRTLAVVHVFYPQFWPELAKCLRNLICPIDLVITYVDEPAVIDARKEFPSARYVKTSNCGFDVWPFIKVLQETDYTHYACIVKLHTKRDFNPVYESRPFCGYDLRGSRWRERLLRFISTPEAWAKTLARFADPTVGMVADDALIVGRKATPAGAYDADFDRAVALLGLSADRSSAGTYVAGTMFAAKPAALTPLLRRRFAESDFAISAHDGAEQFAHVCERALGLTVSAAGLRVAGCDDQPSRYRRIALLGGLWFDIRRFFWQNKVTSDGHRLVKVCRIPIWRRKGRVNV